jgi:O-acetyl-ADP-ribose deacetylase (regulator of RNase III)
MIIQTIKGSVIDLAAMRGEFDLLIHGCNCFNTMKSGVAKAIATKWPGVVDADNRTTKGDVSKLGSYTTYQIDNGLIIVNAYTQYDYGHTGRYFEYAAFAQVLRELEDDYNGVLTAWIGKTRVLSPKIGSGLGGGDWNIIEKMISQSTLHFTIAEL